MNVIKFTFNESPFIEDDKFLSKLLIGLFELYGTLSNKYDYILVFAHGTVNHYIYYWLTGEYIGYNMKNCEVVSVTDKESLFVPFAFVPKGFMINVQDYIDNQNLEDKVKILNL